MMKYLPSILLLSLAPWLVACGGSEASTRLDHGDRQLQIERGDFNRQIMLTGELAAADNVSLLTPNANIWPVQIRWIIGDGEVARQGDRLVEFDASQLTSNLEQMLTQVNSIQNEISSRRAQAAGSETSAVLELEQNQATVAKARLEADIPSGLEARVDYERKQLDYRSALLQLAEAERKVQTVRATAVKDLDVLRIRYAEATRNVAEARRKADLLTINAPRDGIVLVADNRREGRPFKSGDNSNPGQVVARMPDLATLRAATFLFDVDDNRVRPGMAVRAILDAFPEEEYAGRVVEVKSTAEVQSRRSQRRYFKIFVDLDQLDRQRMLPGMSLRLEIEEERREDVLLVPRASLLWADGQVRVVSSSGLSTELTLGPCDLDVCVLEEGPPVGTKLRPAAQVMK